MLHHMHVTSIVPIISNTHGTEWSSVHTLNTKGTKAPTLEEYQLFIQRDFETHQLKSIVHIWLFLIRDKYNLILSDTPIVHDSFSLRITTT